jgi:hypothetical protein
MVSKPQSKGSSEYWFDDGQIDSDSLGAEDLPPGCGTGWPVWRHGSDGHGSDRLSNLIPPHSSLSPFLSSSYLPTSSRVTRRVVVTTGPGLSLQCPGRDSVSPNPPGRPDSARESIGDSGDSVPECYRRPGGMIPGTVTAARRRRRALSPATVTAARAAGRAAAAPARSALGATVTALAAPSALPSDSVRIWNLALL